MNVRDLYPQNPRLVNCDLLDSCAYSYQPMIDSFGNVLVQVSDRGYQGDTRVLLEDSGLFGMLIFGWGSCSGCDALQGCNSFDDLQRLYDSLKNSVQWWESAEDALDYFEKHDWEGDYSWHQEETHEFARRCKDLLAAKVAEKHDYFCPSLDGDGKPCTCEQNPADCGQREWCHEPGGCMCESAEPVADLRWVLRKSREGSSEQPTEIMADFQAGDDIEIDTRRLFMDDPVWTPAIFLRYASSNKTSDSGDMVVLLDGKEHLCGRHYARKRRSR